MSSTESPSQWNAARGRAYQPLVIVLAAVSLGIVVDRFGSCPWWLWMTIGGSAWAVWYLCWRNERMRLAMSCLMLAVAGVGGAWHHACWHLFAGNELGLFARETSEPVCLEGIARGVPRRIAAPEFSPLRSLPVGDRSRVELNIVGIRDGKRWLSASGNVSLSVEGHLLGVKAGDCVRVFGQLVANSPPDNPGEFDFAEHNRAERRLCAVRAGFPDAVTVTATGSGWSIERWIDELRTRGAALLQRDVGEQRGRLASAMFLGIREDLDQDQYQAFVETGTVHLLVISGLNVWILAACLRMGLRAGVVPSPWILPITASVILLYAIVTDAQPPVVRATVMVLVMCLAQAVGRRALDFNTLAAAALVVLAINPSELFRAGTQLSFLCVAVLICLGERGLWRGPIDPLDRLIQRSQPQPVRLLHRLGSQTLTALVVSCVVCVVISPLVMSRFHLVSPVAILLGPLVSLPVTLAMASGFLVFGLGVIVPSLAGVFGWLCDWNLWLVESTIDWARGWPGSHFWVSGPADWWLLVFYGGLTVWALRLVRPPRRWCLALATGWCTVGLTVAWAATLGSARLDCTFVSVGHGSAVVMRLPNGQTLLYDAGRMGSPQYGERAISAVLWSQGIRHLDAVVLSHADADHYNALPGLLEKFSVGVVYVSPVMFDQETTGLGVLRQSIEQAAVPLREISSGDRLRTGADCVVEVMHPSRRRVLGSDNSNSIVLSIAYQGRRILLTGDLESPGLDDLLADEPCDCDILMAPHHGSRFSDPPGMARWSTPEWVVISGSDLDRSPAVEESYSSRGSAVLHTALTGAVHASIFAGKIDVKPWR